MKSMIVSIVTDDFWFEVDGCNPPITSEWGAGFTTITTDDSVLVYGEGGHIFIGQRTKADTWVHG